MLTQFMAYSVCAGLNWVWFGLGFFQFWFLVGFSFGEGCWGGGGSKFFGLGFFLQIEGE